MNKFGLTKEDIKTITDIFQSHKEIEEVIVFGSRATNTFKTGSDVDLALKGRINREFINTVKRELEETNLPYFFDLVDYASVKDEELSERINREGKNIFFCINKGWEKVTLKEITEPIKNQWKVNNWDVPTIPEQKAIADVLSCLDDKIELLRKQNETLEKIAQTIFKHWFVDFELPNEEGKPYKSRGGEMVASELGEIPKGWTVGNLEDTGAIVCGKTPSKSNNDFLDGRVPFIKIPDMHNNIFIINTEDSLTEEGANSQKNKYLPKNTLCISCIATVGLVSITSKKSQTNQQINSIIPQNDNFIEYLFFTFKRMNNFLNSIGSGGTATLNINTGVFSNLELVIPDAFILDYYHRVTNGLFDKILNNSVQIQTLSTLRDTLLPKLMSGQLRVNF